MPRFKADLHIHTCLSPCGDLDMSPRNIIAAAKRKGMDIIAITDHNSTRNVRTCLEIGKKNGVFVIPGCEVNTQEEVHCLAYFPDLDALDDFQCYLDEKLPDIENEPEFFGYQVAVDENEVIIYEEQRTLFTGIQDDIEGVEKKVHAFGGIFVPAHIDRMKNGIYSQLGFVPVDLQCDAFEVSRRITPADFLKTHPELAGNLFLQNSDAHLVHDIAFVHNVFEMAELNWESFRALFSVAQPAIENSL
ncbi:MAG: PHP domain-containing protein [Petrimonas sp.]|nr:PHP domain-containing protein [Petrimonas sp.]